MIAYGAPQQTLVMLGFALAQSALTRHLHQQQPAISDAPGTGSP
ncbi:MULTISPECIES: hypothetical protein [unclassified Streptomyces]